MTHGSYCATAWTWRGVAGRCMAAAYISSLHLIRYTSATKLPGFPSFGGDQHGDRTQTPYAALRVRDMKLLLGNPGGGELAPNNRIWCRIMLQYMPLLLLLGLSHSHT